MLKSKHVMEARAKAFYGGIGCPLTQENLSLAVCSLTMPCYANEFRQKFKEEIGDHSALATVGDACWSAFVLSEVFTPESTKEKLTEIKQRVCTNDAMNSFAKEWLDLFLFYTNNDLQDNNAEGKNNGKGYATALEGVVGFLFLKYRDRVFDILRERFLKNVILSALS